MFVQRDFQVRRRRMLNQKIHSILAKVYIQYIYIYIYIYIYTFSDVKSHWHATDILHQYIDGYIPSTTKGL